MIAWDHPSSVAKGDATGLVDCHTFHAARRRYVDAMLDLYEEQPFLSRLVLGAGRWFLFQTVVALHAGFDERDRSSWPTLRLVRQTLSEVELSSPRHVHDMVARLIHTGFVAPVPLARDRRVRILTPTPLMLAHDRARSRALAEALDVLLPGAGAVPGSCPGSPLGRVMRSARSLHDNPPMLFFMRREAGIAILMVLMRRMGAEAADRRPLCFADLGRRFGVSRTHVRLTLREACRLGHLSGAAEGPAVAPATLAGFDRFVADELAGAMAGPAGASPTLPVAPPTLAAGLAAAA